MLYITTKIEFVCPYNEKSEIFRFQIQMSTLRIQYKVYGWLTYFGAHPGMEQYAHTHT
jgi:hypothetical protein